MLGAPGFGVVDLITRSVDKVGVVCVRLWFVAWACVAWLGLCVLRVHGPRGLRVPKMGFWWLLVVWSRCIM